MSSQVPRKRRQAPDVAAWEAPGWVRRQRRAELLGTRGYLWVSRFGWAGSGTEGLSLIDSWPCVTGQGDSGPELGPIEEGGGLWAPIGGFACERSPLPEGGIIYPLSRK